jgi:hypothetical protein
MRGRAIGMLLADPSRVTARAAEGGGHPACSSGFGFLWAFFTAATRHALAGIVSPE